MESSDRAYAGHPVVGVGHTGITVSDLRRSCAFYRDVLKLRVSEPIRVSGASVEKITGVEGAEVDIAFVRCPGHVLELLCFVRPENKAGSTLRTSDPGFFHLCLKVRSLDRVIETLGAGGFRPLSEVQTVQEGPARGMRVVYARDPDGVVLELIEEPPGLCFEGLFFPPESP
jgi:catechol 2,3-dioxygenase-like lactoylglutathione lyase family enzyme